MFLGELAGRRAVAADCIENVAVVLESTHASWCSSAWNSTQSEMHSIQLQVKHFIACATSSRTAEWVEFLRGLSAMLEEAHVCFGEVLLQETKRYHATVESAYRAERPKKHPQRDVDVTPFDSMLPTDNASPFHVAWTSDTQLAISSTSFATRSRRSSVTSVGSAGSVARLQELSVFTTSLRHTVQRNHATAATDRFFALRKERAMSRIDSVRSAQEQQHDTEVFGGELLTDHARFVCVLEREYADGIAALSVEFKHATDALTIQAGKNGSPAVTPTYKSTESPDTSSSTTPTTRTQPAAVDVESAAYTAIPADLGATTVCDPDVSVRAPSCVACVVM